MDYVGPLRLVYFAHSVTFPPTHKDSDSGVERTAGWDVRRNEGDEEPPYGFFRGPDGSVAITHKPTGHTTYVEREAVKSWTPAHAWRAAWLPELPVPAISVAPPVVVYAPAPDTAPATPVAKAVTKRGNREFGVDDGD